LTWASKISPAGSWNSSYIPSTSDIVSICYDVLEISEVLKYSFSFTKKLLSNKVNI
jgi:hypothetical protein